MPKPAGPVLPEPVGFGSDIIVHYDAMTPSRRLPTGHGATISPNGCGAASRAGSGRRCGKTLPPGWLETEDERMIRATITMFLAVAASGATGASKAATTTGADPLAIVGATLVTPDAPPVDRKSVVQDTSVTVRVNF